MASSTFIEAYVCRILNLTNLCIYFYAWLEVIHASTLLQLERLMFEDVVNKSSHSCGVQLCYGFVSNRNGLRFHFSELQTLGTTLQKLSTREPQSFIVNSVTCKAGPPLTTHHKRRHPPPSFKSSTPRQTFHYIMSKMISSSIKSTNQDH